MKKNWPQGNLTNDQWLELLGIEYTLTHYPKYYNDIEYDIQVARLNELRKLKD